VASTLGLALALTGGVLSARGAAGADDARVPPVRSAPAAVQSDGGPAPAPVDALARPRTLTASPMQAAEPVAPAAAHSSAAHVPTSSGATRSG
jgi:hypothetical protein